MSHLLVVEDEERVLDFVSRGLRAEGYTVTVARTGPDGLEAARAAAFAAIILDRRLPGMPGAEVCQALRAGGNVTPILMLTALDAVEDRVEGLRTGADDYLVKPFSPREVVLRVAALLRRAERLSGSSLLNQRVRIGDVQVDVAARSARLARQNRTSQGRIAGRYAGGMASGPSGSSSQRGACRSMPGEASGRMSENASAPALPQLASCATPRRSSSTT